MTFALRYASNRHTVAISIVYNYIIEWVDAMSETQKKQMSSDIDVLLCDADDIAKDYLQRLKVLLDDK